MKQTYQLTPNVWHKSSLSFDWDKQAGELSGKDVGIVQEMIDAAIHHGSTALVPPPSSYDIDDPLTKPDQMAAVLGYHWRLPAELQAVYPVSSETLENIEMLDEEGNVVDTLAIMQ